MTYDWNSSRGANQHGDIVMKTWGMKVVLVAAATVLGMSLNSSEAQAFWGHRQVVTTNYALPTVPVTAGYAPVVVARPAVIAAPIVAAPVVAAPVVTAGYASFAAPVTSYYAPAATTSYYAPAATTSYYAPAATTSYYAPAPTTSYYAPSAVAAPVTSYYAPAPTYVAPTATYVAPTTTFYAPAGVVPTTTIVTRRGLLVP
jgi:hypothetical protein